MLAAERFRQLHQLPYVHALKQSHEFPLTPPSYFYLIRAFNSTNGDIPALANQMASLKSNCMVRSSFARGIRTSANKPQDVQVLTTFSENHDFPRFPAMNPDMSVS